MSARVSERAQPVGCKQEPGAQSIGRSGNSMQPPSTLVSCFVEAWISEWVGEWVGWVNGWTGG